MEHPFGDGLIERARGAGQLRLSGHGVGGDDRFADATDEVSHARLDDLVARLSLDALSMALERRGMIRHGAQSVPCESGRVNPSPRQVVGYRVVRSPRAARPGDPQGGDKARAYST